MNTKETGGPAFPCHADIIPSRDRDYAGMALRDYFAAKALPMAIDYWKNVGEEGLTAGRFGWNADEVTNDALAAAELSYRMADAMLKARGFAAPARPAEQINADLLEALKDIAGYWNRDQNETAMADACWHAIQVAEKAIAKATGEQS